MSFMYIEIQHLSIIIDLVGHRFGSLQDRFLVSLRSVDIPLSFWDLNLSMLCTPKNIRISGFHVASVLFCCTTWPNTLTWMIGRSSK
jgi:hypothetical protein